MGPVTSPEAAATALPPASAHAEPPPPLPETMVDIPVPAVNDPNFGGVGPITVIDLPKRMFVRITIEGSLSLTLGTAWCNGEPVPDSPLAGQTVGPLGAGTGGFAVTLSSSFPLTVDPTDPSRVTFIGELEAGPITVSRSGGGTTCSVIENNVVIESHAQLMISGGQTVTVEGIEGLSLHADNAFVSPPGDTVAFTVASDAQLSARQWFWMPGDTLATPAGRAQFANVSCSAVDDVCRIPVTASGRMYATAKVEGFSDAEAVSQIVVVRDSVPQACGTPNEPVVPPGGLPVCPPMDTGPEPGDTLVVSVTLARTTVEPVLDRTFNAVTQFWEDASTPQRTDTIRFTVSARFEPSGTPASGASVALTIEPVEGSGGHSKVHTPAGRPPGRLFAVQEIGSVLAKNVADHETLSLVLPPSGTVGAFYRTSGVGGQEGVRATVVTDSATATAVEFVTIQWPGLVEVPRTGPGYQFEDAASNSHGPDENYLAPGVIEIMESIWTEYITCNQTTPRRCPMSGSVFTVTGASVISGGLFDIARTWSTPRHTTHRVGRDVDFDDAGAETVRATMRRICKKDVYIFEGARTFCLNEDNHFHAFLGNTFYNPSERQGGGE